MSYFNENKHEKKSEGLRNGMIRKLRASNIRKENTSMRIRNLHPISRLAAGGIKNNNPPIRLFILKV